MDFTQKEKDFMIHMMRVMGDLYDENKKQVIEWILAKRRNNNDKT